ncbi:LPXTG cell wall anchor domain-containing protein [Paractinoplanes hotanensis]|uniref:LPXTG cell wall anchor domain-containing protein n=1 Tax=Paractinoplanes hotanensis TaxID=2906497 RepID=A0ABT0XZW1_9ACTN|nr:LPXTG cell wall anchor domain-containing protein [Actinoplanes hotanensis]MCM4079326.1 LPXTG cell wall anchor domain-containing protein [Actinoplanes hotanensis]
MRLRPIALPAAIAALALGGLAAPAQAAPEDEMPMVGVLFPEQIAVIDGTTKTVRAEVVNIGPQTVKNVVVNFTNVDPAVKLTLPEGCDATSCQIGDIKSNGSKVLSIKVAVTGDKIVSGFEVAVGAYSSEVSVVRSAGGVDLEIEPIGDLRLGRGQSKALPITVHNAGSESVDSVGLAVLGEDGLSMFGDYRNCLSLEDIEGEDPGVPGLICKFDEEFTPGSTFQVSAENPIKIGLNKDAGGPYTYTGAVLAVGVNDEKAALLAKKKTGKVLSLDALTKASGIADGDAPDDLNEEDNIAGFGIAVGKSAADSAAVGTTISGRGGDKKTFEVAVRNLGPTSVIPVSEDFEWYASARITIPAGVKLTAVDEFCMPVGGGDDFPKPDTVDGNEYDCIPHLGLGVGETSKFVFTGTLTGDPSEPGSIVVDGGVQDGNAKNDRAAITVALTGDGGEGGGLPVTGTPTGLVALGGVLLLLAGGVAAYVFRRRRIVTTL